MPVPHIGYILGDYLTKDELTVIIDHYFMIYVNNALTLIR